MGGQAHSEKVALVIVGMCGSGKSTLAALLSGQGWPVVRFGDITISEIKRRGLPVQEANERTIREGLRNEYGMAAFAMLSLPAIREALSLSSRVAIDGLYSWSELRYLRQNLDARLVVVSVFTPREERYLRLGSRPVRPLSREEAESRDFAEIENLEKGGPIAFADHTILNAGGLGELEEAFRQVLECLEAGRRD